MATHPDQTLMSTGELNMNKEKVQQILQLEAQAQGIKTKAEERAKQIVSEAKEAVQKMQEESVLAAQQETKAIKEKALSEANITAIRKQSDQKQIQKEELAKKNFDKAVEFVINQVTVQE
jgi:vacuolar-type H+-ATPase subunit H